MRHQGFPFPNLGRMASFELTQVKRENHPFHSNILPFFGAGNSAPAVQANSLHAADGGQQMFPCSGHLANVCICWFSSAGRVTDL